MEFHCPKCGRKIEMSEHALYLAGYQVVCSECASTLTITGGVAYIVNDKVTESELLHGGQPYVDERTALERDPEVAPLLDEAIRYLSTCNAISVVMLQRYFDIPAERAIKLMNALELKGVVGPYNNGAPRKILIPHNEGLPIATQRRRGDAIDQALRQMEEAQANGNEQRRPRVYSCGCSTLGLILFGLLLLYYLLHMCH